MLFFRKVAENNCDEVEELLSNASDPAALVNEAADAAGNTALHLAAEKGNVGMVNVLIKHGAKLDVANTSSGTRMTWNKYSDKVARYLFPDIPSQVGLPLTLPRTRATPPWSSAS